MKVGVHKTKDSFSDRWIDHMKANGIEYKIVDAYSNDIVNELADCDFFMWHVHQGNYKDKLFAKQLLFSLQLSGKRVFPDMNTVWHFDDKVGQKYLLESINAPLVSTYVFYTKQEARSWVEKASFPKVFKLRGGAGASNVKLVKSRREAVSIVNKAFGRGFPVYDKIGSLKERWRKYRCGKTDVFDVLRGVVRLFVTTPLARILGRDKGYVYFQDFIENNTFDIRIIIVGNKAFAIKRMNRENDFRASGSGSIIYEKSQIDERCVKIAFEINKRLQNQSIAFDFVFDSANNPLIIEISFGFVPTAYDKCQGYWDTNMDWHEGSFSPQGWMVDDLIEGYMYGN
ncbi:MAG: RimK family alpha-L-glutamate ligase [Dysgonomonas sp.]